MSLEDLRETKIEHIAIANPKTAPYGKLAEEALKNLKLWDIAKSKLVFADNVMGVLHLVDTGNAQIGITALSLSRGSETIRKGHFSPIPIDSYHPHEQGFVLAKRAKNNREAQHFIQFILSPEGKEILENFGFTRSPLKVENHD